jgi:hypothetical protein
MKNQSWIKYSLIGIFAVVGVFVALMAHQIYLIKTKGTQSTNLLKLAFKNLLESLKASFKKKTSTSSVTPLGNSAGGNNNAPTIVVSTPITVVTPPTETPINTEELILFVFAGESNAGNQVHNDHASPSELGQRNIKILNNSSLVFEPLNISGNNSIDQFAAPANSHGWDLGLANLVDAGAFGGKQVFLVNLSQGGSLIGQYNEGADTNYRNKIVSRASAAMAALRAITNNITVYVVYSHGINDEVANILNESQFQTATQNHLIFLNSQFGNNIKVVMTKFGAFLKFNQAIQNIVNANANYRAIETVGLGLQDTYHFNYGSQKYIITESVNLLKSI